MISYLLDCRIPDSIHLLPMKTPSCSTTTRIPAPGKDHGFALVVTIAMLVLMVVVAVGLLSLASVSAKSTSINSAEQRARSNARMALMMAIDKLQMQLGPDQRISANASILSSSAVANPHWLGAWNSWRAGGNAGDSPDGPSDHSTIFSGGADDPTNTSMRPTYASNRRDHFREWLVSLDEDNASLIESGQALTLDASSMPNGNQDAVILVGEGSLGESVPTDQFVHASLLPVEQANSRSKQSGRYGWWVGDNSQKATIMADRYRSGENLTAAEQLFRSQAPGSTGTKTTQGLEDITNENQLHGVASLQTLDLVDGVDGAPSKANFHAITTQSLGVLADVREGGLKRDLSTLLERSINPAEQADEFMLYKFNVKDAWANNTSAYPTLSDTPQECVPLQDLAAFYQLYDQSRKGGIQYGSSALPDAIQVTTPDFGTPANFNTTFKREYTALYRNPIPIKVQFLLSLVKEDITQADRTRTNDLGTLVNARIPLTDLYKLRLAVMPAITLWNPYNVPLVMEGGEEKSQQLIVKPPAFFIRCEKQKADGSSYTTRDLSLHFATMGSSQSKGTSEGRAEIVRLNFARTQPIVFQPGEVRVFSLPYNLSGEMYYDVGKAYHDNQNMGSPKNLVDATAGWNPEGYFTFRHSTPTDARYNRVREEHFNIVNELTPAGLKRFSLAMAPGDELAFTIFAENEKKYCSRAGSPTGSSLSFYMAQRNYSAQGDRSYKGYGFLNLRHQSLVSRFGAGVGGSKAPATIPFNQELLSQGMPGETASIVMEPIPVAGIAAATEAGESWPFVQFAMMAGCETNELANGGLAGGRKFRSRPFLHSSPFQPTVIDSTDAFAPYNHGWNWWVDEMNSVLEALVQESQSGNGYYGGGYSSESGTTHIVQQEIPVAPPISIAALSHARLGGFSLASEAPSGEGFTGKSIMEGNGSSVDKGAVDNPTPTLGFQRVTAHGQGGLFPHVLQAIGNSYANPNLEAGAAYDLQWKRTYDMDDGERNVTFADHSYLANKALWDEYFFSSITPQSASIGIFDGEGLTAKQVAQDFFLDGGKLPNRRFISHLADMDSDRLDDLFDQQSNVNDGLADKVASHLMVEGPFNVNSTSIEAWKILFSSLKDKPIAYLDGGNVPLIANTDGKVPVGMGTLPTGQPIESGDADNPAAPGQWKGARVISDEEIDALAQAMVREVKKRGPFLSLSEFINRRLDSNNTDDMALKGALQAALDYDGSDDAGPEVTINKSFRQMIRGLDSDVSDVGFAFPDAATGPAAYGSAAYVDQADVLRNFAAQLTPRGDTFTIRAYGDSLDANGRVEARAWCEAVVQRLPDYLDSQDENHVKWNDLQSEANKRFGRRFQITSFRWLNASEV